MFSTPYYSPQSLLPLDPPPYTLPTPKPSKGTWRTQPTVSLASYPLPDGTWRWVSRSWMIDMRGDGLVQHDGFEYAWSFRSSSWRPEIGTLSTGAWVRRRRWVRLMVCVHRPDAQPDAERAERAGEARGEVEGEMPAIEVLQDVPGATRPPSVVETLASEDEKAEAEVWLGDDGDWERCRAALRKIGRDGKKLELWKRWFGFGFHSDTDETSEDEHEKGKSKADEHEVSSVSSVDREIEEEVGIRPVQPPRGYIARVICAHVRSSFSEFISMLMAVSMCRARRSSRLLFSRILGRSFWRSSTPPASWASLGQEWGPPTIPKYSTSGAMRQARRPLHALAEDL